MNGKLFHRIVQRGRTLAVLSAALGACLPMHAPQAWAQGGAEPAQNALAGARVFGSKGCARCHAVNGLGATVGPDLARIARQRSFYDLAATMWNHLPEMGERMREYGMERPTMSPREVGDLIAFLFTLNYFDLPGDVEVGQRLFSEKECVVCHQVGVRGGVVGPALDYFSQYDSPMLVAAAMWNHGPAMAEEMRARGLTRPTFTGGELTDLITYLASTGPEPVDGPLHVLPGRPEAGQVVFRQKRCSECHRADGVGSRIGPDLARRAVDMSLTEFAAAMWNKEPSMRDVMVRWGIGLPKLEAGEMADLVAYLYSLRYFAESGDPDAGRRHLQTKGCLQCHPIEGSGGTGAVDLAGIEGMNWLAAIFSAMWNHAPLMERAMASRGIAWPELSADEMADITAFLLSLESANR